MSLLRHYNKEAFRKKFRRYRILFFVSFAVFLCFLILEILLFGSGNQGGFAGEMTFARFAARLFVKEATLYLIVFLMGVTVYAPMLHFVFPALRGIFAGFAFSSLFCVLSENNLGLLMVFSVFYTLLSSQLFFSYLSFCTCVSLHLFTDRSLIPYKTGEKTMFGGSLFYSGYFCNAINFRFLFTYSMLFLSVLFLSGGLCLLYAFLRGLAL